MGSVRAWITEMRARTALRRCARVGAQPVVRGRIWIHGGGTIHVGDRVVLDASRAPIELHVGRGATLVIGDDVRIYGGTSIEALQSVVLERGCVLNAFSKVLDNHFHPVHGNRHRRPESTAVVIGEEAVIGERAILLPGARLEPQVQLEAGVVIARRVPRGTVLAGYPPRPVRKREAA